MRIYYSTTSPFARKVSMFAKIVGTAGIQWSLANPMESEELRAANPLGKVPALVDGELCLFESALICEYLDQIWEEGGGRSLFHKGESNYFQVQRCHAMADGITEAAVATVMENRREGPQRSPFWLDRWHQAIEKSLDRIDLNHCGTIEAPNIATVSLTASLGYLDFRLPHLDWRNGRPQLSAWLDTVATSEWYRETLPELEVQTRA